MTLEEALKEIARLELIIKGQERNIKQLQRELNIAKIKLGLNY